MEWKNSATRKPLILKGARQTGKTFLLSEFGRKEFSKLHYLDFQKGKKLFDIFEGDFSPPRIISLIEFQLNVSININDDILFFDEIQECSRALTSLKYFCEEMPQLAVVCAGSLLGVTHSKSPFPVGKVSFLNLYPLSFEEFLLAGEENRILDFFYSARETKSLPSLAHSQFMDLLKEYMVVGGMPEVVAHHRENRANSLAEFAKVREIQSNLLLAYLGDFSKYSGRVNSSHITAVFESIPAQLAKNNKRYISSQTLQGGRFSKLKSSIDWLTGAGIVHKVKIANTAEIPFSAFTKENFFKLYFIDTGLLGALGDISPGAIIRQNDLFATFKGAFCENYAAQELISSGYSPLYSWASNTSEIEFMLEIDGSVFPIEVKAGLSGKLKSLNVFAGRYKTPYRTRFSGRGLEINTAARMHSYPLYLISQFPLNRPGC